MDMPEKVLLQMNRGWRSVEEVVCGGTEYIRADAGNVLPELKYPWFYYDVGQSPLHMLWYCQIANFDTKETHFAEECDNLRAAALDAIAKIGENNG